MSEKIHYTCNAIYEHVDISDMRLVSFIHADLVHLIDISQSPYNITLYLLYLFM